MEKCIKNTMLAVLALLVLANIVHAGVIADLDTSLTDAEKDALATTISPVGKLIGILQYLAGAIIVLGIIAAGYTYYKGDPVSKQQSMNRIGAVIIGSILVFGAVTISRTLGLGI
jgi:type IV secretory pathway VirB2 component (pilin)